MEYPRTPRTTGHRNHERLSYEQQLTRDVLDEALICHVGFEADGPLVLPMIHARIDEVLYLHLSTGSGLIRAGLPTPVCLTATIVDGLVFAKSQFRHSMNYRSVVVRGQLALVTDTVERERALAAIVDHVAPGRSRASRPPNRRELAATAVACIDLVEVSTKVRAGPPGDDADDLDLPYWSGVIPIRAQDGAPEVVDAAGPVPQSRGFNSGS